MTDESEIPHPGAHEHFGENIPVGGHKQKLTPGKHPSSKYNLEKEPLHVEGGDPESDLIEEMRLMPRGEDMHRWSGGLLMLIIIVMILLVGLGVYFVGAVFFEKAIDVTIEP